jgi:hypothetical protein
MTLEAKTFACCGCGADVVMELPATGPFSLPRGPVRCATCTDRLNGFTVAPATCPECGQGFQTQIQVKGSQQVLALGEPLVTLCNPCTEKARRKPKKERVPSWAGQSYAVAP